MQVVIDTVSIQHLLRGIKPSARRGRKTPPTALDKPIKQHKLALYIDTDGGLVDEWEQTCGTDTIQVLITYWASFGAVKSVIPKPIERSYSRKLSQLGFVDTIDRLILRIALATTDRRVISDDPDFWDPADKSRKGNPGICNG